MDRSPCRSCRRPVCWARSAATGKLMPLERDDDRGNVLVDAMGCAHAYRSRQVALAAAERNELLGEELYLVHHAVCPEGDAWRGRAGARSPHVQEAMF